MWRDLIEKGYWNGEIWNRRKNGELYPELLTISAVHDKQGSVLHYVALFTDITPIKEHEEQLKHMAHFDLLTTLPNRALLGDRLHQAMTQTQRRKQLLAVAYLDLDGFKAINDTYGHKTGDQLLVALASRMRDALREGDTLARLGGDEFVVVLIDLVDTSTSLPMLNRLLKAAALPVRIGELELQVSASLGITFYPQNDEVDADQLLRQADQAMYQAKLAGKNRYQIFDADQDRSLRGHHESLARIRRALTNDEFVLYYQPKVNLRTGKMVGAEALIRWQHPDKGLLSPASFLPTIENHALALEVGEWVIHTAIQQLESWRAEGDDIPVSVNVGARQLQHGDFVERLQAILSAHSVLKPGDLTLEVLETSALEDLVGVSEIIEKCKDLGVLFSLDDFGTGYSSLSYLKRLSVNQLKIDQSFVRDMLEDPDDLTILEGVISLAGAFRREVIAEGVETMAHGEMLLLLGCDLVQGYGIARPMPAADIPAWATSWQPDQRLKTLLPVTKEDLPLLFALTEHRAWVLGIEQTLQEGCDLPSDHSIHHCRFGAWLSGEGARRYDQHPDFPEIKQLHEELHSFAESLAENRVQGKQVHLPADIERLRSLSETLLARLRSLITKQL
jgi:diguanylate cyclase (GGDEF)-like protein